MIDERIAIWNLLHDGEITAVSGADVGELDIFVSIPYLRRRLKPLGDSFVITLSGLTRLEFRDFSGSTGSLRDEIEIGTPAILSTESETMPITIDTTMGQLTMDFQRLSVALDTGQPIAYEAIEKVFDEYWTEWEAKPKKGDA
jgi:hypothetical protein